MAHEDEDAVAAEQARMEALHGGRQPMLLEFLEGNANDDDDDDDDEEPMTVERLRAIPKLWFYDSFFDKCQLVEDETGMVGCDDPNDNWRMLSTWHSLEFYDLFDKHLTRCGRIRNAQEKMEYAVAILIVFMDEPHWYHDTEDVDAARALVMRLKRLLEGLLKKTDAELPLDPENRPVLARVWDDLRCRPQEAPSPISVSVLKVG